MADKCTKRGLEWHSHYPPTSISGIDRHIRLHYGALSNVLWKLGISCCSSWRSYKSLGQLSRLRNRLLGEYWKLLCRFWVILMHRSESTETSPSGTWGSKIQSQRNIRIHQTAFFRVCCRFGALYSDRKDHHRAVSTRFRIPQRCCPKLILSRRPTPFP